MLTMMKIIDYVAMRHGAANTLAKDLGVSPVQISLWAHQVRQVPLSRCIDIEKLTGGRVRCEDMRPDVDWGYLRGTKKTPKKHKASRGNSSTTRNPDTENGRVMEAS